jgi:uncharacterized protein YdeI (YjbR/CyaY-like superfamily)
MDPAYFATADEWHAWLAEHHDTAPELWVGFHKKASGRPPGYQRTASWWVISAKKEETRRRRLAILIEDSAHGRAIKPLLRKGGGPGPA